MINQTYVKQIEKFMQMWGSSGTPQYLVITGISGSGKSFTLDYALNKYKLQQVKVDLLMNTEYQLRQCKRYDKITFLVVDLADYVHHSIMKQFMELKLRSPVVFMYNNRDKISQYIHNPFVIHIDVPNANEIKKYVFEQTKKEVELNDWFSAQRFIEMNTLECEGELLTDVDVDKYEQVKRIWSGKDVNIKIGIYDMMKYVRGNQSKIEPEMLKILDYLYSSTIKGRFSGDWFEEVFKLVRMDKVDRVEN